MGAILGSTVDTCSASVLVCGSGRISHIFYVAADSDPEVLLSLLLQNGDVCPVDASGCSFASRSSHLENWKYFSSFTWLTRVMMGSIFRRSVRHFLASSSELRPLVTGVHANSSRHLVVIHILSQNTRQKQHTTHNQQQNNNNTTTTTTQQQQHNNTTTTTTTT